MSSRMIEWKKKSHSPSRSPKSASPRDIYVKASASPRSASPARSSSPVRSSSRGSGSAFTPRTTENLRRRESKVERRRLQAEAKAHKLTMLQQKQEYTHQKRMQDLEHSRAFKETHGVSKTTMIAGGLGVAALLGYILFS